MAKERDTRRREILNALAATNVRARVYLYRARATTARPVLLTQLVEDLSTGGASLLVVEALDGQEEHDRRSIRHALRAQPALVDLVYDHLWAHEEPLLWIADAVAWAYGAGGDWRRRVEPLVDKVADLGP